MGNSTIDSLIDFSFSEDYFEMLSGIRLHDSINDHFAGFDVIEYPNDGVAIYLDSNKFVKTIFLYGEADDRCLKYSGIMPFSISFDLTLFYIEKEFGIPDVRGVNKTTNRPWVRYDNEKLLFHIEFSVDCTAIKKVTLMSPSVNSPSSSK